VPSFPGCLVREERGAGITGNNFLTMQKTINPCCKGFEGSYYLKTLLVKSFIGMIGKNPCQFCLSTCAFKATDFLHDQSGFSKTFFSNNRW
jgi:hypothetical protein